MDLLFNSNQDSQPRSIYPAAPTAPSKPPKRFSDVYQQRNSFFVARPDRYYYRYFKREFLEALLFSFAGMLHSQNTSSTTEAPLTKVDDSIHVHVLYKLSKLTTHLHFARDQHSFHLFRVRVWAIEWSMAAQLSSTGGSPKSVSLCRGGPLLAHECFCLFEHRYPLLPRKR